jgi:hypothetical protein
VLQEVVIPVVFAEAFIVLMKTLKISRIMSGFNFPVLGQLLRISELRFKQII